MSDTKQLESLREALRANGRNIVAACDIDRAIAALRAEEPKACAATLAGGTRCERTGEHEFHQSGCVSWSGGSVAPQPSRTAVPGMPEAYGCVFTKSGMVGSACETTQARALHAACVTIAQERDDYWARLEACEAELAEAQAALEAAKAQEPVAWMWVEDGIMHEPSRTKFTNTRVFAPSNGKPLYAAPVAAPDTRTETLREIARSISPEQHEAALKQARAQERERCAKEITNNAIRVDTATQLLDAKSRAGVSATARVSALYEARDIIRALPEEGES